MTKKSIIVFVISLVFNFLCFCYVGVKLGGDSSRFTVGAEHLLTGVPFDGTEISYVGYIAIVALLSVFGFAAKGIVVFQIFIAAFAAVAILKITKIVSKDEQESLLPSLYFVFNPEIVQWHNFVLTDSLFTSFCIISIYLLTRFPKSGTAIKYISIVVAIFTILIRPNGFILIPAYLILGVSLVEGKQFKILTASAIIVLGVFFVSPAFKKSVEFETPEKHFREGTAIWGSKEWAITMPIEPNLRLLSYVIKHSLVSAKLFFTRVLVELAHVRPFYSRLHNAAIIAFFWVLYPFAFLGFFRFRKEKIVQAMLLVIAMQLGLIGLTFADWDGRFLIYIMPFLSLIAFLEISIRIKK